MIYVNEIAPKGEIEQKQVAFNGSIKEISLVHFANMVYLKVCAIEWIERNTNNNNNVFVHNVREVKV